MSVVHCTKGKQTEESRSGLPILPFANPRAFSRWLECEHGEAPGLWVKLAKKCSATTSISLQEAIDLALCFGWIDGHVVKYDADFYLTRFTPRRPASKWSMVNRSRAQLLIDQGNMQVTGLAKVEAAKADGRWEAAYPSPRQASVPDDLQQAFDANKAADTYYHSLNRQQQYAILFGLATVKRAETRARKIQQFVKRASVDLARLHEERSESA